eukprot:6200325-Pleurochrysis_carterae.AAC.1
MKTPRLYNVPLLALHDLNLARANNMSADVAQCRAAKYTGCRNCRTALAEAKACTFGCIDPCKPRLATKSNLPSAHVKAARVHDKDSDTQKAPAVCRTAAFLCLCVGATNYVGT